MKSVEKPVTQHTFSIRPLVIQKIISALTSPAIIALYYSSRAIHNVLEPIDFTGHSYHFTNVPAGKHWIYQRADISTCLSIIQKACKIEFNTNEVAFLAAVIDEYFPEQLAGQVEQYHTPEYLGDPGLGCVDAQPAKDRDEIEVEKLLDQRTPQDDISSWGNGLLCNGPFKAIFTLLTQTK